MNAQEAVVAAVKAALDAAPALATEITRARHRPIGEEQASAINVYFAGSLPSRGSIRGAPIDWLTSVRFECLARAAEGQTGDQVALALHAAAWQRLMASPTLGGLAMDMQPGPVLTDEEELETPVGCAIGTVQILHRTASNTLEPQP